MAKNTYVLGSKDRGQVNRWRTALNNSPDGTIGGGVGNRPRVDPSGKFDNEALIVKCRIDPRDPDYQADPVNTQYDKYNVYFITGFYYVGKQEHIDGEYYYDSLNVLQPPAVAVTPFDGSDVDLTGTLIDDEKATKVYLISSQKTGGIDVVYNLEPVVLKKSIAFNEIGTCVVEGVCDVDIYTAAGNWVYLGQLDSTGVWKLYTFVSNVDNEFGLDSGWWVGKALSLTSTSTNASIYFQPDKYEKPHYFYGDWAIENVSTESGGVLSPIINIQSTLDSGSFAGSALIGRQYYQAPETNIPLTLYNTSSGYWYEQIYIKVNSLGTTLVTQKLDEDNTAYLFLMTVYVRSTSPTDCFSTRPAVLEYIPETQAYWVLF